MIREARPSDQAYVASTWVASILSVGDRRKSNANALRRLVDGVLDRDDVRVIVACSNTDENHILGWLCYTRIVSSSLTVAPRYVAHYAYVRDGERKKGRLAEMMFAVGIDRGTMMHTFDGPSTKALARTVLAKSVKIHPHTFLGADQ